jgi:hypothetical protein
MIFIKIKNNTIIKLNNAIIKLNNTIIKLNNTIIKLNNNNAYLIIYINESMMGLMHLFF